MSKPEANYMWGNVENSIQIIESRVDLINRKTDLYDPIFFTQDNDGCSQKSSHIVGEFLQMKKNDIQSVFKFQFTYINERFSMLEGCLNSSQNKSKTFPPLENEFLSPSKNITLKKDHIIYPMKNKYLCDYNPRCIMSSGLMFDDPIMGKIKSNELPHHHAETDCVFTQIVSNMIHMYRGSLRYFFWKKGTYECLEILCEHFSFKKNEIKDYWTHVLKNDTSSGDMDEMVYHWLVSFESPTRSILLCLHFR